MKLKKQALKPEKPEIETRVFKKIAQENNQKVIVQCTENIETHTNELENCFNPNTRKFHKNMLKQLQQQRAQAQTELKRLKRRAKNAKKQMTKLKNKLERAGQVDPKLLPREQVGRPRQFSEQSGLLNANVDLANADQKKLAADPRRRS